MPPSSATTTDLGHLRPWQRKAVLEMREWEFGTYLIAAAPGAGKTRPSLHFAKEQLDAGKIKRVVVVCPTAPLTRQWAQAAAEIGLQLLPDSSHLEPPGGFQGVSVTYARAAASHKRWKPVCTADTLIIADEAHHLGDELAWGDGFTSAFSRADRWLLLSGTPFRSDRTPIPGAEYDNDGYVVPNVSYKYGDAVKDRVCRPIRFIPFDGTLQWVSGDKVVEASFADPLIAGEASRRYRTAISTELADGLPRILGQAAARLKSLRGSSHPDAGGLVVAADSESARRIAKILRDDCGEDPITVLYTDTQAHKKLADFRKSDRAWVVAVNMVSEGVDIPRLRVGVYATAAKTPLIFRQVVGRFVRTIPGRPPTDRSWLYIPADIRLRQHATDVEDDIRHLLIPKEEGDGSELDEEQEERAALLPGEKKDFKAVKADVQVQMDLFAGLDAGTAGSAGSAAGENPDDTHVGFMGKASAAAEGAGESGDTGPLDGRGVNASGVGVTGPGQAPAGRPSAQLLRDEHGRVIRPSAIMNGTAQAPTAPQDEAPPEDPLDPWAALDDDEDEDDDTPAKSWQRAKPKKRHEPAPVLASERPAWEHQEMLRKRRHALVGELARLTKAPQAQVNAEINQTIGVAKVDQATNEQLERSIEVLLDRLAKRR
ncbi:MAG: DEAD/DEAH box helicase family protein [Solirubrobacteraceae bacterium]|nr:DEAD/DEAH box helicase family protein [Patulibacter sp.]